MPSSTFTFVHQFRENLAKGVHNFTSDSTCTPTFALCAAANAPTTASTVKSGLTEISYTNLSSRVVTGITAEQVSGIAPFTATDLVLTASGGSVAAFRYLVLFDDDPTSPADPIIGWFDYGSDLVLADTQTLTIDFGVNGFGTIS